MRLGGQVDQELLARQPPQPYRLVEYGRREKVGSIDYKVPVCDYAHSWSQIIHEAGERPTLKEARAQWDKDFAPFEDDGTNTLGQRMWFLVDADNTAIGTATAWQDADTRTGRVHWVALRPTVQGKGLAKPMLAQVLRTLHELHPPTSQGAVAPIRLVTHSQAARAIGMYLEVGFVPAPLAGGDDIQTFSKEEDEGWKLLSALGLPITIPGTQLD